MENRTKEINEYKRKHVKRIALELRNEDFEKLKAHIEKGNETVNGFIKRAINETIERDNSDAQ